MKTTAHAVNRRQFLKDSTAFAVAGAAGLAAFEPGTLRAVQGANDRVRVGFIGLGNRGSQLLHGFLAQKDCTVAAFCDVYEPYLQRDYSRVDPRILESLHRGPVPRMGEELPNTVRRFHDFRRLLEQKDLDAVVVATPDHWHAVQTILAFDAGKDVYVEKPLSLTIAEGRKMVRAAQRTGRVNQVGLHRRSSRLYRRIHELIRQGRLGRVNLARAYRISDMFPDGIGKFPDTTPPPGFDWDLWLGPQAARPFRYNIAPYKFRWWKSYSSQIGNWGVHYFDAIRWMLDEEAPAGVSAHGGKYVLEDDRTIPDTMEVTFEFASGRLLVFGQYEANAGPALLSGEIELRGTLGNLYPAGEARGAQITAARAGQFQTARLGKEETLPAMDHDLTVQHIRNFLDCVKSRRPCHCDLETGHRSTTFAHLANIALATKKRIEWDAQRERITNDEAANRWLDYEYRDPWKVI